MSSDLRIIPSDQFVRMDAEGHFDLAATRMLLSDVIWACAQHKISRVLVDIRDARADLTAAQLCELTRVAREVAAPAGDHRIAILARPEVQFDRASFVAEDVQEKGWNLGAFHDLEKAINWITRGSGRPDPGRLRGPEA